MIGTELDFFGPTGRDLWVLMISSQANERNLLTPEVKYVGNIHGNEAVGRELLLHLIEHLTTNYGRDQYVTSLVDSTRIHILPAMNPDGFDRGKEGACSGADYATGRYNEGRKSRFSGDGMFINDD